MSKHFGCDANSGGELESDGGSGTTGSHWEKRVFQVSTTSFGVVFGFQLFSLFLFHLQNEYMTGSSSSDPVFSNLTLALFEDSGWYKVGNLTAVQDDVENHFIWWGFAATLSILTPPTHRGRSRGCAFLTKKCNSKDSDAGGGWPTPTTWPGYFCADKQANDMRSTRVCGGDAQSLVSQATSCAFDLRGKARCGIASYSSIPPEANASSVLTTMRRAHRDRGARRINTSPIRSKAASRRSPTTVRCVLGVSIKGRCVVA